MGSREDHEKKCREDLGQAIVRCQISFGSDLLNAIEAYIDAKIEVAKADLVDRIEQRGVYDPDY